MKQFLTFLGIVALGATAYGQAYTDIVYIPDANFKKALLEDTRININRDTEISYAEARKAYIGGIIDVSNKSITSLQGIEAFENITELHCHNNQLTSLDVSKNTKLTYLDCGDNKLTSLDVSKNTALTKLYCGHNQLTSLDVTQNTTLIRLYCNNNQLTSLNLSKNIDRELWYLYCNNNKLTSLDVSKNIALQELNCSGNQLTSLDLSKNRDLIKLYCHNNQLTQLNLKNGDNATLKEVLATGNNLSCILIDRSFTPPTPVYKAGQPQTPENLESGWEKDTTAKWNNTNKSCEAFLSTNDATSLKDEVQVLNPVKDHLIIKGISGIKKVEIYNTAGQLAQVLYGTATQVSHLPKGIYIIKITTNNGEQLTKKIVKE